MFSNYLVRLYTAVALAAYFCFLILNPFMNDHGNNHELVIAFFTTTGLLATVLILAAKHDRVGAQLIPVDFWPGRNGILTTVRLAA